MNIRLKKMYVEYFKKFKAMEIDFGSSLTKIAGMNAIGSEGEMAKQQSINRNKYKDIKRFDHHQMEMFACSLYEQGVKDGATKALEKVESGREQMDLHILRENLMEIKGIGSVKADAIVEVVKELLEGEE